MFLYSSLFFLIYVAAHTFCSCCSFYLNKGENVHRFAIRWVLLERESEREKKHFMKSKREKVWPKVKSWNCKICLRQNYIIIHALSLIIILNITQLSRLSTSYLKTFISSEIYVEYFWSYILFGVSRNRFLSYFYLLKKRVYKHMCP